MVPSALTSANLVSSVARMELHLTPEMETKLAEFSASTGRAPDDLVQDAIAGYFQELVELGDMLGGRYDELKSGRVNPIDGEAFFDSLRQREDKLFKPPQ